MAKRSQRNKPIVRAASLNSPGDQIQVSLELNRRGSYRASVIQLHLNREKPGYGTDRGGRVPVENKLRTAETEGAVSLRADGRSIQQDTGCSWRRSGAAAGASDYRCNAAQIADDTSCAIQKFPFEGHSRTLIHSAGKAGRSDRAGWA